MPDCQVYFNYRMLLAWLLRGMVHAFLNFFVATLFLGGLGGAAHFPDYLSLGTWSYWSCVLVANSTLLLHAQEPLSFQSCRSNRATHQTLFKNRGTKGDK